ncbi:unnamed protein product, partial [Ectocarpus sp. 12 AP-2014]
LPLLVGLSHIVPFVLLRDLQLRHGTGSSRRLQPSVEEREQRSQAAAPTPTFGAPPSPESLWSPT